METEIGRCVGGGETRHQLYGPIQGDAARVPSVCGIVRVAYVVRRCVVNLIPYANSVLIS